MSDNIRWEFADESDRQLRDQLMSVPCSPQVLDRLKRALQNTKSDANTDMQSLSVLVPTTAAFGSKWTKRFLNPWGLAALAAGLFVVVTGWSILQFGQKSEQSFYAQSQLVLNGKLQQTAIQLSDLPWFESVGSQLSLSRVIGTETFTATEGDFGGTIVKISSSTDEIYVMAFHISRPTGYSRSLRPVPAVSGGWGMAAMESKGVLIVVATKGSLRNWINVNAFT